MSINTFSAKLKKLGVNTESITDTTPLRGAAGLALPQKVVRPLTVEHIQAIQKIAHAEGVPLWVTPNASGNGLQVAQAKGAQAKGEPVLVDLSNMKAVLNIDNDSAHALVEPGVSYQQLSAALQAKGYHFWIDSGRNAADSVVGGICDRSLGYSAYSDNLLMQCGMEVVTADGALVRTGMGALPKGDCWQLFKLGFGPYMDGSFTQSGLGIPTKIGLWISPAPPAYRPFAWRIDDEQTMVAAVEVMRDLRINMVVPNTVVVIDGDSERKLLGGNPASWNIYGGLYGLPKNVDILWGMLNGIAAQLKVRLEDLTQATDSAAQARAGLMQGKPAAAWHDYEKSVGSRYLRLVFALPIEGDKALHFAKRTQEIAKAAGCGVVVEQGTAWRTLMGEVLLSYAEGDVQRALSCGNTLISEWAKQGIGVVRADPTFHKAVAATYSDPGFSKLQALLAEAVGASPARRAA